MPISLEEVGRDDQAVDAVAVAAPARKSVPWTKMLVLFTLPDSSAGFDSATPRTPPIVSEPVHHLPEQLRRLGARRSGSTAD